VGKTIVNKKFFLGKGKSRTTLRNEHGHYTFYKRHSVEQGSRDSSVGKGTTMGQITGELSRGKQIYSLHRLRTPPSLLSNGYWGPFHQRVTTHSPFCDCETVEHYITIICFYDSSAPNSLST
jgi:hypothetical protein